MSATPTSALGFQNFFSATLTGDITSSSTDILMDAIPNATEGFLVIEPDSTTAREVIFYNSKTALKVVCPSAADGRGQDDTTAGAHSTGATVIMAPVAGFWEAFQSGRAFTNGVINTSKLNKASDFIKDHVFSGCVITADSVGVNKNYSISSGVVYIAGERCTVAAVSAQTVGASKDRYIDLRANGDGTASYVTNEVANNAASQALTAGDLRVGIVVAGATTIAATTSISQGGFANIVPVVSGQTLKGFDSLGNLVYPKGGASPVIMQNPYKFSAYLSAPQTGIADATFTKVAFDSRLFDTGSNFDAVTNRRFTAPVAGFYQINAYATMLSTANNAFEGKVCLYKNGTILHSTDLYPTVAGTSSYLTGTLSDVVQLAASDYLEIFVWQDVNTGTTTLVAGTVGTRFNGYLVSAS